MSFYCLEDLDSYLYAFYESRCIDLAMQFDLMPISIRKKDIQVVRRNSQRDFLKPTFMIKVCDKKRKPSLQKVQKN